MGRVRTFLRWLRPEEGEEGQPRLSSHPAVEQQNRILKRMIEGGELPCRVTGSEDLSPRDIGTRPQPKRITGRKVTEIDH